MATTLTIILEAQNRISGDLKKVSGDVGKLKLQLDKLTATTAKTATGFTALAASMRTANTAGKGLQTTLLALGGITLFVGVVRTLVEFEQKMAEVRAVTGATGDTFDALSDKARELGASTVFSASEAAAGLAFLGRAGFTADQALGAIEGTLNLAAAGG